MNPLKMLSDMEKQASDPKWIKAEEDRARAKSALIQKRRATIRDFINRVIKTSDPIEPVMEADLFPMLDAGDAKELTESIKTSRKVEMPILIDDSGRVVDGRNRIVALRSLNLKICMAGDVEGFVFALRPSGADLSKSVFVTVNVVEPEKIRQTVINANIHRRHLSKEQKAFILTRLYPKMDVQERVKKAGYARQGISNPQKLRVAEKPVDVARAEQEGISVRTLESARSDDRLNPEIGNAVLAGDKQKAKALRSEALAKKPAKPKAKPKNDDTIDKLIAVLHKTSLDHLAVVAEESLKLLPKDVRDLIINKAKEY